MRNEDFERAASIRDELKKLRAEEAAEKQAAHAETVQAEETRAAGNAEQTAVEDAGTDNGTDGAQAE